MPVSEQDVIHFLGRIGFIPTDEEIAEFVGREIPDIVDQVLTTSVNNPGRPAHLNGGEEDWRMNIQNMDWWLNRMRRSRWNNRSADVPSALVEKLTLFWHGHFASEFDKVDDAVLMWEQNNIFRTGALGDFEELCQRVSLHGAMLIYLDNESNRAGAVQENFARELMELFTMGIGNYSEFDVVEMARAWTGFGTVGWLRDEQRYDGTYEFHPDEHDEGDKTIFGITDNWDGPATITEIVRGSKQQPTARFIATKLWRYFVNGAPSPGAIDQLAAAFVASDMNITELMRALLTHPDFWSPASRNALVKTPTQFVVDFARRTGREFIEERLRWQMQPMGQTLFDPPNVAGWGTNGYWLSTATMWGRARYATNERWSLTDEGFLSELDAMDADTGTAHLLSTFGIRTPSQATIDAVKDWYQTTEANYRWALTPIGISLVAMTPEFQVV